VLDAVGTAGEVGRRLRGRASGCRDPEQQREGAPRDPRVHGAEDSVIRAAKLAAPWRGDEHVFSRSMASSLPPKPREIRPLLPPHTATVVQPKLPFPGRPLRPPHAAQRSRERGAFAGQGADARALVGGGLGSVRRTWGGIAQAMKRAREEEEYFELYQFAGGTGGEAGDACLVSLGEEYLVIDFGANVQASKLAARLAGVLSYSAVVTHFHADHCGTSAQRQAATELFLGSSSSKQAWNATRQLPRARQPNNNERIWSVDHRNLEVDVWFIRGYGGVHLQDENTHSAGVYGEVRRDDDVVFRWLSLGDMVSEAWANVAAVLPDAILDYVKLPHHGSPNNHMASLFRDHVDGNTALVCSGWNNVSDAWKKIKVANPALSKDQIKILTHKPKDDLGITWSGNVSSHWSVTVSTKAPA
jgi:beta-lactamase superfamily II metal-dependent hydrolase